MTPTQKSLKRLRAAGWHCEVVEHWVMWPKPGHRKDLFGWADIIAVNHNHVMLVQTTARSGVSARIKKIVGCPVARLWLSSPHRHAVVHGWKKGDREPRIEMITTEMLQQEQSQ